MTHTEAMQAFERGTIVREYESSRKGKTLFVGRIVYWHPWSGWFAVDNRWEGIVEIAVVKVPEGMLF